MVHDGQKPSSWSVVVGMGRGWCRAPSPKDHVIVVVGDRHIWQQRRSERPLPVVAVDGTKQQHPGGVIRLCLRVLEGLLGPRCFEYFEKHGRLC